MPKVNSFWNDCSNRLLDVVYPRRCGCCGLLAAEFLCSTCRDSMREYMEFVPEPFGSPLDGWFAAFHYEGRADQAVQNLKYHRVTSLALPMAKLLGESYRNCPELDADIIIPVPIHWTRRCFRGFNQAELLCTELPPASLDFRSLKRNRATRPQVGLTMAQREENLVGAFQCARTFDGEKILLIDDVTTSGQTARECARTLLAAGAGPIVLLTFASG